VDVSSETLPLELIHATGPDGQYLDKKHTLRHFKDQWHPLLFERSNYEGWVKQGSQTLAERAAARVSEILSQHTPDPLPEMIKNQLRVIVENPTQPV
jgi:trimethylamine--corrinoid protein Co-methyltransferase